MTDRMDVLADQRHRLAGMRGALLAAEADPQLRTIVRQVAGATEVPIALVSLVLDRIQYFLAQHGLPPDLACSRATDRDVSFCQVVVRDQRLLVVEDAIGDERVPQDLVKRFGIRAYLGAPLRVRGETLGSLCALDLRAREFSEAHRDSVEELAEAASTRLDQLVQEHADAEATRQGRALGPALREARDALGTMQDGLERAEACIQELAPVLRLLERGGENPARCLGALQSSLSGAGEIQGLLGEARVAGHRLGGTLRALGRSLSPTRDLARLGEVLEAAAALGGETLGGGGLAWEHREVSLDARILAPMAQAVVAATGLLVALGGIGGPGEEAPRGRVLRDGPFLRVEVEVPGADAGEVADAIAQVQEDQGVQPFLHLEACGCAGALVLHAPSRLDEDDEAPAEAGASE